jgi:hypothetical protein
MQLKIFLIKKIKNCSSSKYKTKFVFLSLILGKIKLGKEEISLLFVS